MKAEGGTRVETVRRMVVAVVRRMAVRVVRRMAVRQLVVVEVLRQVVGQKGLVEGVEKWVEGLQELQEL
jgi:hypothetical protein